MRALSMIGLLVALLVVALLAKNQLTGGAATRSPGEADAPAMTVPATPNQARQLEQQVRESLDAAMQSRRVPEDP